MPTQKADWFTRNAPDVRTGAVAGGPQKVGYSSGTSNPPNGGQITDIDNPEPNDTKDWFAQNAPVEIPAIPAGLNAPLPNVPSAPVPAGLTGAPTLMQTLNVPALALDAGDVGIGALKGTGHTLDNIGNVATLGLTSRPALKFYNRHLGTDFNIPTDEQEAAPYAPSNGFQSAGKGIEQAAEFLIPGLGEEAAGAKLAEIAPRLGRAAAPLGRIAVSTLGSGAINKLQGGTFGTGAAMGGIAGGAGEGLKAIAPYATQLAQGVFRPGADTGKAILDETTGLFPGSVRRSAQQRLDEIGTDINKTAKAASVRPNPARYALPGPTQEIPLHSSPDVPGTLSRIVTLYSPDATPRLALPPPTLETPMSSYAEIFPDQLPNGQAVRPPVTPTATGTGFRQYLGQIPGERGGAGRTQGVLRRPFEGDTAPLPATLPNRIISMREPQRIARDQVANFKEQNEPTMRRMAQKVANVVTKRSDTGDPIPEDVTPWEAIQLRRGTGNVGSVGSWNPFSEAKIKGLRNPVYGAQTSELHAKVPGLEALDTRYSNLKPVMLPKPAIRFGHVSGPLAGTLFGGYEGYKRNPKNRLGRTLEGAAIGGGIGAAAPFALNLSARSLYSPVVNSLLRNATTGAALQLERKK